MWFKLFASVSAMIYMLLFQFILLLGYSSKWLVGRLTSTFNTKIGYIRDKVFSGDLVPPG